MANRNAKRLYGLEIDEVSLVDRSANQHAGVAIAKRDEGTMTVLDAEGYEVEVEDLEPGEAAFNEEGELIGIACADGDEPEDYGYVADEDGVVYLDQSESVGKAAGSEMVRVGESSLARQAKNRFDTGMARAGARATRTRMKAAGKIRRNPFKAVGAAAGGGALVGAGAGYGMSKSLGADVYEELSKALGSDARNEVVSKAIADAQADALQARREANQAKEIAKNLVEQAEYENLYNIAQGYGLPGDPAELAEVLKSMPAEQAQYLDSLLSNVGEYLYSELGTGLGETDSTVMGQIEAMAKQAVTKSDVTESQAVVALFDANPEAYDTYLAENR